MKELIHNGGPVMVPIIACALVGLAIIVERLIYFFLTGANYAKFKEMLLERMRSSDLGLVSCMISPDGSGSPAKRFFQWVRSQRWNRSPYVKIATAYVENIGKGHRSREEALKRIGSEEIERMERNFKALSAISHVSPLLGLLGTVTGIIAAFTVISELGGQVDVSALAGGIWEAMLTTAAGLSVAIPTQLAYLYFEKVVSARANRMSYTVTYLNEALFSSAAEEEKGEESLPHKGSMPIRSDAGSEAIAKEEVG
jgi:biopolymer transport protein ExbB